MSMMNASTTSFNVCIKYMDTATFYRVKLDLALWRVFDHFTRHQCLDPDYATFWFDGKPLDPLRHTFKDVFTNALFHSGFSVPEITCFYEEQFSCYCTCPGSVHFENMEPVCACHAPIVVSHHLAPGHSQNLVSAQSLASATSSARFDCPCTVF